MREDGIEKSKGSCMMRITYSRFGAEYISIELL